MDEALSEEEKQLESWLNQIKQKQLLCDQGLQHVNWSKAYGLQQLGTSENHSRFSGDLETEISWNCLWRTVTKVESMLVDKRNVDGSSVGVDVASYTNQSNFLFQI
ncbi:uncharacterized protein LOC123902923 [Trifolium pratense]|uniref:uncharacterized protein LOC123902923 n=1 Tax=Trifolium pratense TaxID=57577 RepID=UPI001E69063B|nr:uncharacterized protein LOC123902923 [Trifolium pratense]